jgi:hypothetical protein
MRRISALVKRYRLTAFFILAYALSWWAWIPYALGVFPNPVALIVVGQVAYPDIVLILAAVIVSTGCSTMPKAAC